MISSRPPVHPTRGGWPGRSSGEIFPVVERLNVTRIGRGDSAANPAAAAQGCTSRLIERDVVLMRAETRRVLGSLLLLLLSTTAALAATEVILRLLGHRGEPIARITNIYRVDDPVLDWRYVPNSEVQSGHTVYRYNAAGFRDVDHALQKPHGVIRIVVIGDSVTEGYGVEFPDIFARRLQSELGDTYEVINICASGMNTPQEIHLLERSGLAYEPDLVILNFVLNDVDFFTRFAPALKASTDADSRIGLLGLSINPRVKRLLKSSALVYLLNDRALSAKELLLGKGNDDYFDQIWARGENRNKVSDGFSRLSELQGRRRFDVVVLIWPLMTDYRRYRFSSIHTWVSQQAEKFGLAHIDLLPHFSGTYYRELIVSAEDAVHPNALGHRLAATAFLTWYRSADRAQPSRSSLPGPPVLPNKERR
jgi:lysophospholipase L1-like esterase